MAKDRIKNYAQGTSEINILKDIRTDLSVSPSSYTPDTSTATRDRVVTFAQAEEELVVLGDIEKGVKQQVVKGDIADKRITNIEKLLQGNLYDYQTDTDSAYTKSVPAGAMPYAGIEQIGGKTVVWNQLVDSGTTSVSTISGHMYYTLIDGTASIVTSDGTAITIVDDTADMVCDLTLMFGSGNEPTTVAEFQQMFPASYYAYNEGTLLSAGVTEVVSVGKNLADFSGGEGIPSDTTTAGTTPRKFVIGKYVKGLTVNNIYYPSGVSCVASDGQLEVTTSTGVYGIGVPFNCEGGATYVVSQTSGTGGTIGLLWYDANGSLITYAYGSSATAPSNAKQGVAVFISQVGQTVTFSNIQIEKGSTATTYSAPFTISIPIPASIQALEGYGWSAGTAYNYIDIESKKFVQNVFRHTLTGTTDSVFTNIFLSSDVQGNPYLRFSADSYPHKETTTSIVGNIVADKLQPQTFNNVYGGNYTNCYGMQGNWLTTFFIKVDGCSTLTDYQTYLASNPLTLQWELATPIETDISEYLTDDNLIQVESGGTLTFENQHGDDYQIPVPSEETYMIDLQASL